MVSIVCTRVCYLYRRNSQAQRPSCLHTGGKVVTEITATILFIPVVLLKI